MPRDAIGAGFGRTGTLSLKMAHDRPGLGPCHHMGDVLAHPDRLPRWPAAVAGQPIDREPVFASHRARLRLAVGFGAAPWPGSAHPA